MTTNQRDDDVRHLPKHIRRSCGPTTRFAGPTAEAEDTVGKILRGAMVKGSGVADFKMPTSIDDPGIFDEDQRMRPRIGCAG